MEKCLWGRRQWRVGIDQACGYVWQFKNICKVDKNLSPLFISVLKNVFISPLKPLVPKQNLCLPNFKRSRKNSVHLV